MTHPPQKLLLDLLVSCFPAIELEKFVFFGSYGREFTALLPATHVGDLAYAEAFVRALYQHYGLPPDDFFDQLEEARPRRRQDIAEVREAVGHRVRGPSTPAPLPDARVHLDRIYQWFDVVDRSRSERHEVFLIHGPPGQHVAGFADRSRVQLNEECRRPHVLKVVSTDIDGIESPTNPRAWESRVAQALHPGIRAVPAFREVTARQALFLFFGLQPLSPDLTPQPVLDALIGFLPRLGEIVTDAEPAHPVRLYFAIEADRDHPWAIRLHAALVELAQWMGGRYVRPEALSFPPWKDVIDYMDRHGFALEADDLRQVHEAWEQHEQGDRDFLAFAASLDGILRKLRKK